MHLPATLKPTTLNASVLSALRPRTRVDSWEWINAHGRDMQGRMFDGSKVPHFRGVCEAWDDVSIRKIVLMWGTRLCKTLGSHQLMACAMVNNPMPGIYGTATGMLATRTVREKIYKILEHIPETRVQLLPVYLRSLNELRLSLSTWVVANSGSETLLSDWPGFYGVGNEIDKWDKSVSDEGDSLAQFLERFKDSPSHKILLECSPSIKGKSRIESQFLFSDQRSYYVPCPRCGHFQVLTLGNGTGAGLRWKKRDDGSSDADLAEQTAHYICEGCLREIHNEHRPAMMRAGVWAPKGQTVDRSGRLIGKPERVGAVAGFQISSLYSLQLTWGRCAAAFVSMRPSAKTFQMFVNGWLAETWEPYRIKTEPQQVAERLMVDAPVAVIPKWATWRFDAVDVQAEYFKWMTCVCGPAGRVAIIDRGACDTWTEVFEQCVNKMLPRDGETVSLLPALTFVDSGDGKKTDEVYAKCREWSRLDRLVIPCKGANTDMGGEAYVKTTIGDGVKEGTRIQRRKALQFAGTLRVRVNSFFYEPILQRWFDTRKPGEPDSLELPVELAADDELVRELCNGVQSDEPSKMDPDRLIWKKRWENEANDYRDCLKYARCAMDVKFRGNWRVAEQLQPPSQLVSPVPARVVQVDEPTTRGRRPQRPQRIRRERVRNR